MLRAKLDEVQTFYEDEVAAADEKAMEMYNALGPSEAIESVTFFSTWAQNELHKTWMDFYGELFVRFRDFYTIVPKEGEPVCGCEAIEVGLSETTKERIVQETGDRYKVAESTDKEKQVLHGEAGPPSWWKESKTSVDKKLALS